MTLSACEDESGVAAGLAGLLHARRRLRFVSVEINASALVGAMNCIWSK